MHASLAGMRPHSSLPSVASTMLGCGSWRAQNIICSSPLQKRRRCSTGAGYIAPPATITGRVIHLIFTPR